MKPRTAIRDPKAELKSKVFCILGDKRVYRSKSPAMFNAVLKQSGIDGMYVPFMVEPGRIGEAVRSLKILNIAGANITLPYKEAVLPHINVLSEGANIIGAINTVARDGEVLKGYNTNAIGFMDALEEAEFETTGKTALVFGNGGAARAVVFMLNWLRAGTIYVAGRSVEKAMRVVTRIRGEAVSLDSLAEHALQAHIVVNATSVSGTAEATELALMVQKLQLPDCELVIDLNYGRSQNFWEDMAIAKDIPFMDGLSILANQARRSFALWTGVDVDPKEFLKALDEVAPGNDGS